MSVPDLMDFFFPNPATVVVWDSQVKDGYKRNKAPAADNNKPGDSPKRAAPVSWDGKKTSGVVEELLKNASDKAYGANSETLRMFFIFSKKCFLCAVIESFFCLI